MSNIIYLNLRAKLWHLAAHGHLWLVHCDLWPGGAILTSEALRSLKAVATGHATASKIAPEYAAMTDLPLVTSEDLRERAGAEKPKS